jgi:hypothetical protein
MSVTERVENLFHEACLAFQPHINYDIYYLDFVVAGQSKQELASAVILNSFECPNISNVFPDTYKEMMFYVRPMNRNVHSFNRMENYNVIPIEEVTENVLDQDQDQVQDQVQVLYEDLDDVFITENVHGNVFQVENVHDQDDVFLSDDNVEVLQAVRC